MALELVFEVGDARLERLDLVEQGQHDGPDGGGRGDPIRGRNTEGRRKLVPAGSMRLAGGVVKLTGRPTLPAFLRA